ncbi:MAG: hypothetical protein JNM65_04100 [Verrucomicrobiaceae bacterium]|nr:hypothetical protein [Verrucomicrobiaceae bacterium]
MNAFVRMTGPHAGAVRVEGKARAAWRVTVVESATRAPLGTVYHCLSYARAVSLSCNMAHDRKLHLHLEALPR